MDDKSKERTATAFSTITPLLGLGGSIASAIPNLRKPPKAEGHVSSLPVAAAMSGVAAQGHGVGRASAQMNAMRAGAQVGQQYVTEKGRSQFLADSYNIQQGVQRADRIAQFGADHAAGMSDLAVGLIDSANARKAERQSQGYVPPQGQPQQGTQNFIGDAYGGQAAPADGNIGPTPPKLEDVIENDYAGQGAALASAQAALEDLEQQEIANAAEAQDMYNASLGMPPMDWMKPIAPHIEERARRLSMAVEEINRSGLSLSVMLPGVARMFGTDTVEMMNPGINPGYDEEEDVGT